MGQSSVTQLASYGVDQAIAPSERFDSESLLELPEFQAAHLLGQRIVIFRGNGGRAFLGDTLRERGAEVSYVTCYHRSAPGDAAELMVLWQNGRLDGLAISSSEGLRNLAGLLDAGGREHLSRTPVFVPHQRIAEVAAELGLQQIILTGPADAGIIAGLREYHWR
jgi:uroporphyrinogen-III synthase